MTALYVPGTSETDPKKTIMAVQNIAAATTNNATAITALQSAVTLATDTRFGAVGDGSTVNDSAIAAAITYCVANNLTLGFPDGVYNHSGTIVWAYPNFKVIALGEQVVFKHTGSGVAHSFNGLTNGSPTQGVFKGVFGGPNRITLKGNAATTELVYVNNWHQGDMKVRLRDAQFPFYGENTGAGAAAAVSSRFDIQIDSNGDGTAFAVTPTVGVRLGSFFGCIFERPIVQYCGVANPAVLLVSSSNNLFRGGTVESNVAGGIVIDSGSQSNVFEGTDFEANGTSYDISCAGAFNVFRGCLATGTTLGQSLAGSNNKFDSCVLQSVTNSGTSNVYDNCFFSTAFTESGTGTSLTNPSGGLTGALKLTTSLGADVALNNVSNYFDGPSIAQGTKGTWFVSGTVTLTDTVIAAFNCKLWDGTTVIASARAENYIAGTDISVSLSGYITAPAGNLRISVNDPTATTGKIVFNASGNSKDSTISGIRIG